MLRESRDCQDQGDRFGVSPELSRESRRLNIDAKEMLGPLESVEEEVTRMRLR